MDRTQRDRVLKSVREEGEKISRVQDEVLTVVRALRESSKFAGKHCDVHGLSIAIRCFEEGPNHLGPTRTYRIVPEDVTWKTGKMGRRLIRRKMK